MTTVETRLWRVLGIVMLVVTSAIPAWMSYEDFQRGGIPEKHVELQRFGPTDVVDRFSPLPEGATFTLSIGDKIYSNVFSWSLYFRNTGKVPIQASDFFEPLQIAIDPPWEIIAIRNGSIIPEEISLRWHRVAPNVMEAKPFLLNESESFSQVVYITATDADQKTLEELLDKKKSSALKITARIVNLKGFAEPRSSLARMVEKYRPALIYLSFRDILVLLSIANVVFFWYLYSLRRAGMAELGTARGYALILFAAFLSYSVAEVVTFYLFGGDPIQEKDGRHLLDWRYQIQNWLFLLLHVVCSIYIFRKVQRAKEIRRSFERP